MNYLAKILSVVFVIVVFSCSEAQSDVFEVRFFTNYIHNKSKDAAILAKIYGSVGDTIDCAIPSTSSWPEATSQFGKMGKTFLRSIKQTITKKTSDERTWHECQLRMCDSIESTVSMLLPQEAINKRNTPLEPEPNSQNRQSNHNESVMFCLTNIRLQVLVIDSKSFYYEFLFNRWLNSSTTAEGVVSQEVTLSRKYGGPRSVQSRGCIDNGSHVWYRENLSNVYKPAIIASLNASNATIVTSSGHTVTVPRDQHYDGSSRPLVVNDDWLKLTMSLNYHFIAAYNQSEEFYFGTSTYVSSKSLTTSISNQQYNWQHIMFHISYADSIAENYVRGGNIRKVNQMSTSFCTDQDPDEQYNPQALDVIFTCQNTREKILGHVVASLTARDLMHCGMMCSRHARCISFNFCDSSNASCKSFPTNCELNDSQYGQKSDLEEGFRFCVLLGEL